MEFFLELQDEELWNEFYRYKLERGHLNSREDAALSLFIAGRMFQSYSEKLSEIGYSFDYPTKSLINKVGTGKKRVVYSFGDEESIILKFLAYRLYKYDFKLSSRCYSFRKDIGAKKAIRRLSNIKNIQCMCGYKLDVHNYFNSIDTELLLTMLQDTIDDDKPLYAFLDCLLTADQAYFNNQLITEKRGAMAGIPISPFFANIYLSEMDRHFEELGSPYARYSDDIIVFADNEDTLQLYRQYILDMLSKLKLTINKDKEYLIKPGQAWDFLGVEFHNYEIDVSPVSLTKIKGKIRRKARSIRRWKVRENISDETALNRFAESFNRKFYCNAKSNELTWARWFFPLLTVDKGLKEIDAYMQQNMRYIATGKHNKGNYRITYATLKQFGYRNLVNEYYRFIKKDCSTDSDE